MHQFIGMWGPGFVAYFIGTSAYELFKVAHWQPSMHPLYWILSETPYYPAQIAVGFGSWMVIRSSLPTASNALGLGDPIGDSLLCRDFVHARVDIRTGSTCCFSLVSLLRVAGQHKRALQRCPLHGPTCDYHAVLRFGCLLNWRLVRAETSKACSSGDGKLDLAINYINLCPDVRPKG